MSADGVSIVHVQESTSRRDEKVKDQTLVATRFKAFESKLDTLTSSMLKVSDTLLLLASAHPHMALNVTLRKRMLSLPKVNLTLPRAFSRKIAASNWASCLTRTCLKTLRTADRR